MEQESAKPPKSPAKKAALSLTIHNLQKNPNLYLRGVTLLLEVQREAGSLHPAARRVRPIRCWPSQPALEVPTSRYEAAERSYKSVHQPLPPSSHSSLDK
jgi:hypothetical protein